MSNSSCSASITAELIGLIVHQSAEAAFKLELERAHPALRASMERQDLNRICETWFKLGYIARAAEQMGKSINIVEMKEAQ